MDFSHQYLKPNIVKIGNAAVAGATAVLLSDKKRAEIEGFVSNIEHIELETTPDFFDVFVEGCQFKPDASNVVSYRQKSLSYDLEIYRIIGFQDSPKRLAGNEADRLWATTPQNGGRIYGERRGNR